MAITLHTEQNMRMRFLAAPLLILAALCAHAETWPEKPIRLLVPSSAGGPPDAYARALADDLGKALGQPLVVENLPGGGGMIAAQQLLRAPADGYTLMVSSVGMLTITPNANPRVQYKEGDFTNICEGVDAGLALAGNPQLGPKNFSELSQWLRSQKSPPSYSSFSPGSPAHFLGYQLAEALKIEMTHVPYKSSPPQITDMMGNFSPLGFVQIATASPFIKAGKLIAFASTGASRDPQLPDVPTVAELGMPQLTTSVWFGLSGPRNLPAAITQRLTQAHEQMTASPKFKVHMAAAGLNATPGICGGAFQKKIENETQRWARIIKATGFSAVE